MDSTPRTMAHTEDTEELPISETLPMLPRSTPVKQDSSKGFMNT